MITIKAIERNLYGKSASRRLRINNQFPGIIYGNDKKNIGIIVDQKFFMNIQNKSTMYKNFIKIILSDEKTIVVKIKSVQYHPYKPKLQHIDFIRT
ncbi:50S ribosomal protein L25 [Candidatus Tachikawaea gelatinosa]|uniref:Large ribosomal subunit protein bL25 n=1 Tax=Candidatus Tachikawaea gelatinosa TaxID=1410383 RepID=A0A090BWM0_9ENTR|nr:50S ribosomal protein L25 [Candidatus Tachikawaea gelatinosa]BAP58841.1 50S ribosomal protein L25 [Candidatus Tachikawaea gelatinosa]